MLGRLNNFNIMIDKIGKKIIFNKLYLNDTKIFLNLLPYINTPSIKMATVDVVPPIMRNGLYIGVGILNPIIDNIEPIKTDKISGFFKNLFIITFNPEITAVVSSLYNSSNNMEIIVITTEMEETVKVAKYSACFVGKANVINGIP